MPKLQNTEDRLHQYGVEFDEIKEVVGKFDSTLSLKCDKAQLYQLEEQQHKDRKFHA